LLLAKLVAHTLLRPPMLTSVFSDFHQSLQSSPRLLSLRAKLANVLPLYQECGHIGGCAVRM
jgi:hypothetical protein